jgi:hypothetical protein
MYLSAQGLKPVKEAAVEAVDDLLADEGPVSNLINRQLIQATKNVGIWLLAQTVVALISILYVKLVETPQTEGKLDPWLVWNSIYIGLSALTALLLVRKLRLKLDRGITETAKKIQVSKEKIELSMYRLLKDHAPRIFLLLSIAIGLSIGIYLITGHFLKNL